MMIKIKANKKILVLNGMSLIMFLMTSYIAANQIGIENKTLINELVYGIILYLWSTWMYINQRRFYRFFMIFVLSVYLCGFISYLFISSFTLISLLQFILSIVGIFLNTSTIILINKERMSTK